MTGEELKQVLDEWGLTAAQGAKVLCLHSNKMSEYLADVSRIPCAIAFSIDALQRLPPAQRAQVLQERLQRPTHGR